MGKQNFSMYSQKNRACFLNSSKNMLELTKKITLSVPNNSSKLSITISDQDVVTRGIMNTERSIPSY